MLINSNYGQSFIYPYISSKNSLYAANMQSSGLFSQLSSLSSISSLSSSGFKPVNPISLQFVQGLKIGADNIKHAANSLQSKLSLGKSVYTPSDAESIAITMADGKYSYYTPSAPASSVRVERLAAGQANVGTALAAEGAAGDAGRKQIEIDVGGKTYQVSFEVKDGDTNKDMLGKMASAINAAGIGVTASVSTAGGESTLSMEAKGTGERPEGQFAIRDVLGDTVSRTGAANVSRQAQDAVYYLNGSSVAKTSGSNTVDIGGGITATFKKAANSDVKITKGIDTENAFHLVKSLADSYNSLFALTRDAGDLGTRLFEKMVSTSKVYAPALSRLGISFDNKGEMAIDREKVEAAAKDGSLERFFSDRTGGYLNQLSRMADDVKYNTGKYVNQNAMLSSLLYDLGGYQNISPRYSFVGMLLDYSF